MLHHFVGLNSYNALLGHPVVGGSFVGYALEQVRGLLLPDATASLYRTVPPTEPNSTWSSSGPGKLLRRWKSN